MTKSSRTAVKTNLPRIEEIGAIVRGPYGQLCRIVEVMESTRLSDSHISSPLDVEVRTEPVGSPGYGHKCAWASSLTIAEPGDRFGAHPHFQDCVCGEPYAPKQWNAFAWYDMRSSWERV